MSSVAFHEKQKFSQVWWVMLLVYGLTALCWWGFIEQIILGNPWGDRPAPNWMIILIWLAFGIGMPLFFNMLNLTFEVTTSQITIRYYPLTTREISFADITEIEKRTYKPIREFGGWGIRGLSSSRTIAYNVKGKQGVELTLTDGRKVMLGSQQPEKLYQSLGSGLDRTGPIQSD
jgi:hypothetical protein